MTKEEAIKLIDDRMCFGRGKWSEHHKPEIDIYWQAGEMAIKALEAEPHWIPVTESPKEEEKSYWVCLEDGGQCQCRWTNDVYGLGANEWSKWGWKKVDLPQYSKVVAYMPLPEPYKGVTT